MGYGNCCGPGYGAAIRRYWTNEECAQRLEEYAGHLENELKAVKERIQDLRKE